MRPIWKGHISFGLVSVPVTLYPAEQRTDLQLHMIDSRNHSRVRYERVNAETGEEVPWDQIIKGFEYDDGNYVLLSEEELKKASPEATQSVDIEAFVDLEDIDLVYFDKPYYLEPGKKGEKGYVLLRETLRETGKVGIARVVIRTREYLAAMVPRNNALVLVLLRFQQELRSPDDLDLPGDADEVGVSAQELKMARTLVDSMSRPWDPSEYHDEYRDALMNWIDRKIESGEVEQAPESEATEAETPPTTDLMEALKNSVAHAGGTRSKPATKKPPKKKAPRKGSKKAAKKTTRKKSR